MASYTQVGAVMAWEEGRKSLPIKTLDEIRLLLSTKVRKVRPTGGSWSIGLAETDFVVKTHKKRYKRFGEVAFEFRAGFDKHPEGVLGWPYVDVDKGVVYIIWYWTKTGKFAVLPLRPFIRYAEKNRRWGRAGENKLVIGKPLGQELVEKEDPGFFGIGGGIVRTIKNLWNRKKSSDWVCFEVEDLFRAGLILLYGSVHKPSITWTGTMGHQKDIFDNPVL